ncbi:MAG: hypothetical protein IPN67_03200 [Bacteroidales bacterium]|nr:hypothetical protein [Bacteroidales bacterium]
MTGIGIKTKLLQIKSNLTRFASRLTGNNDDSEGIGRKTFLKTLKYHNNYDEESNYEVWSSTVRKNNLINNYRQSFEKVRDCDQLTTSIPFNQSKSIGRDNTASAYSNSN